jgi:hypothetical protein
MQLVVSLLEYLTSEPAMLILGLLSHFLIEFARLAVDKQPRNLCVYLFGSPRHQVQTAISVIGAIVGYAALQQTGDLSPLTAFGVGYIANTVPDLIGKRTGGKL